MFLLWHHPMPLYSKYCKSSDASEALCIQDLTLLKISPGKDTIGQGTQSGGGVLYN
jgi:hypothetical protein